VRETLTKIGCWLLIGAVFAIGALIFWGFADMIAYGSGETTTHLVMRSLGEIGSFGVVLFLWSRLRRTSAK
jgi:hypothetical protein